MRVFIVTYLCSVVGVYTCAVDAEQCIRALKRVGCEGATVCEAQSDRLMRAWTHTTPTVDTTRAATFFFEHVVYKEHGPRCVQKRPPSPGE